MGGGEVPGEGEGVEFIFLDPSPPEKGTSADYGPPPNSDPPADHPRRQNAPWFCENLVPIFFINLASSAKNFFGGSEPTGKVSPPPAKCLPTEKSPPPN